MKTSNAKMTNLRFQRGRPQTKPWRQGGYVHFFYKSVTANQD